MAKSKVEEGEDTRPLFTVNERSFIGHAIVEEGAVIPFTPDKGGHVGENLSPANDAAQAIVDAQKEPHPDKTVEEAPKARTRAPKPTGDDTQTATGGDDTQSGTGGAGDDDLA